MQWGDHAGDQNASPGQGGFGRGAAGSVKSIEGDTLLLSTPQDVTTVILTEQTTIIRFVAGERDDLQSNPIPVNDSRREGQLGPESFECRCCCLSTTDTNNSGNGKLATHDEVGCRATERHQIRLGQDFGVTGFDQCLERQCSPLAACQAFPNFNESSDAGF